jgi:hypothetical protein
VIKAWRIPSASQIEPFGSQKDYSFNCATWENAHENEPVWDIRVHPTENLFLSSGADYSVQLWQFPIIQPNEET